MKNPAILLANTSVSKFPISHFQIGWRMHCFFPSWPDVILCRKLLSEGSLPAAESQPGPFALDLWLSASLCACLPSILAVYVCVCACVYGGKGDGDALLDSSQAPLSPLGFDLPCPSLTGLHHPFLVKILVSQVRRKVHP